MKQKPPSLVPVLILTLLTVIAWIFFSVYRALTSKPDTVVPNEISEPLDASLDQETIENVKSRLFLDESQITTPTFSDISPTPSTKSAPESEATESATQTETLSE